MVKIYMFGDFRVISDDIDITQKFGRDSKMAKFLQYLIANSPKYIEAEEIATLLWSTDSSEDALQAVRMHANILRETLQAYGMSECLSSQNDKWAWELSENVIIDAQQLKHLDKAISASAKESAATADLLEQLLFTYAGDFLSGFEPVNAIVYNRDKYTDIYSKNVLKYIEILTAQNNHNEVLRVCKVAIEKVPMDVDINIAFMRTLLDIGRPSEALAQFDNVSNLYYICHDGVMPKKLVKFYNILIEEERNAGENIQAIFDELNSDNPSEGALVCDYSIFKYIFKIYRRNLKRIDTNVFVALVRLQAHGNLIGPLEAGRAMERLCNIFRVNLRTGDTISRQSLMCFVLLLPRVETSSVGRMVLERMKRLFYKDVQNAQYTVEYKLMKLADIKEKKI